MMSRVWLITGASRGLGREWVIGALERGERVTACARDITALADLGDAYGEALQTIRLDVTDRGACFDAVRAAHDRFGNIDVIVNNAGYGQYGFVEELSEAEARAQMDTNFFGALWITQAALPYLRAQGGGHIIQVSSIGGVLAFPNLGIYHASKWALEGLSQALAGEVEPLGIRVTLVEPGGFDTDWINAAPYAEPLAAYDAQRARFESARAERRGDLGRPEATRSAILAVVDAADPPRRVFLGRNTLELAKIEYADRLAEWELWQPVAIAAHGGGQAEDTTIDGMVPRGALEARPEK
ncbi:MAG: SDR family NAD(P)-dependent oxidoreductase [Mycobacterium sp.]|nr:SDR family NAD(P)-dependent oxidoreductase [Mycobacterium sp.]